MNSSNVLKKIESQREAGGILLRAFGRFHLPRRKAPDIEQTAARNRAERLFAVNFRNTWIR
jgi:hypothetical protein